jgi:hypothetical protein
MPINSHKTTPYYQMFIHPHFGDVLLGPGTKAKGRETKKTPCNNLYVKADFFMELS